MSQDQIDNINKQIKFINDEKLSPLFEKYQTARSDLNVSKMKLDGLKQQLDDLECQLFDAQNQKEQMQQQLAEKQKLWDAEEEHNYTASNPLYMEMQMLRAGIDSQQWTINNISDKLSLLPGQIDAEQQKHDGLKEDIANMINERQSYENAIQDLAKQLPNTISNTTTNSVTSSAPWLLGD
jgi:predicted  nucleic acid-binding Zn-ribbon protein